MAGPAAWRLDRGGTFGQLPLRYYLPAARRCQRVRFSIFLCFFLRIRLRRFLMSDPMAGCTLAEHGPASPIGGLRAGRSGRRLGRLLVAGCDARRWVEGLDCCKNAGGRFLPG